jgi:hypothetical protein
MIDITSNSSGPSTLQRNRGLKGAGERLTSMVVRISPLLAALLLLAFPPEFEAQGFYKGIPYRNALGPVRSIAFGPRRPPGEEIIEAMLPGGRVLFRSMAEFTRAIDAASGGQPDSRDSTS